MKSRLIITLVVLCIGSSLLLISCSYTKRIEGDWGPWGGWKQAGTTESRSIHINSKPEGARVYINDTLAGDTPITLSLDLPILKSEKTKTDYESYTPGVIEYFLLFSRPKTSPVSTQREERTTTGSQKYLVEVRKEGYVPARRHFSIPETSFLTFVLKKKPSLAIKPFRVQNNVSLSVAERLYDAIYGRRFGVDISKFKDSHRYLFSKALMDTFELSSDKRPDLVLGGEIIIEKRLTTISLLLTDRSGRVVTSENTSIETKSIDTLPQKIELLGKAITDNFLKEY